MEKGNNLLNVIRGLEENVSPDESAGAKPLNPDEFSGLTEMSKPGEGVETDGFKKRAEKAEEAAVAHGLRMEQANVAPLDEVVTSEFGKSFLAMIDSGAFIDPVKAQEHLMSKITPLVKEGGVTNEEYQRLLLEINKRMESGKADLSAMEGPDEISEDEFDLPER